MGIKMGLIPPHANPDAGVLGVLQLNGAGTVPPRQYRKRDRMIRQTLNRSVSRPVRAEQTTEDT